MHFTLDTEASNVAYFIHRLCMFMQWNMRVERGEDLMSLPTMETSYTFPGAKLASVIEPLAARAMPAEVDVTRGPWRFRYSPGISSRRANSVLPVPTFAAAGSGTPPSDMPVADLIREAESFYAERGMPLRFQMSPASQPAHLDAWLAAQGFSVELPGEVLICSLAAYREQKMRPSPFRIEASATASEDWLILCIEYGSLRGTDPSTARSLLGRIGPTATFVTAYNDSKPIGIGFGVCEAGWLGLFSLATHPDFRRQGAATAIIDTLVAFGTQNGARNIYLQVAQENAVARRLYQRLGFVLGYPYHYRTLLRP